MLLLIASRLNASAQEQDDAVAAGAWLRRRLAGREDAVIQYDSEIDWKALRREHGGYARAYVAAVRGIDKLLVIEGYAADGSRFVSRGQYALLEAALAASKGCGVWRGGETAKIARVVVVDRDDWKGAYGRVELKESEGS